LLDAVAWYRTLREAAARSQNRNVSRLYLRWKSVEHDLVGWTYGFVTFAELMTWTNEWVRSFSQTFDVVVAIPRSGLLVGSIIALKLGKPLTTPELLVADRYWMSTQMRDPVQPRRLLLVDDSLSSGKTFERSLAMVRAARPGCDITRAALIVTPEAKRLVDLYHVEMPQPRLFEWNMLHVKKGVLATDLDGVLCENCPPGVDADDVRYGAWVQSARPYLIPSFHIDCVVSSRLERYRADTEAWLARHGVRYGALILWDIASKAEGRGRHAHHKIEQLLRLKPEMFWESNGAQARDIWRATRIPTLCIDEMRLFA
jgi:hypoxanthine phosphoribosyltransferase